MLCYIICMGKLQRLHCSPEAWDDGDSLMSGLDGSFSLINTIRK